MGLGIGQRKGPFTQVLEGGSRSRTGKRAFYSGIRGVGSEVGQGEGPKVLNWRV